jgi:hypothetical protein
MCFEYKSPELLKHDSRSVLMASTSFGLLLLVAILPTMSVVDNASGQDAQATISIDALNSNTVHW